MSKMVVISIIVTSYNVERFDDIHDLLLSIRNQVANNYELIYVTEGDMVLQEKILQEAEKLGLAANVIHNNQNPGLAEARNLGAALATGEILGFVDDDVVLDHEWSQVVEETFRKCPNVVGATGPAYPVWVGEPAEWVPEEFDWILGCTRWFHSTQMAEIRNCWGMNMAFRRHQFGRLGGFSVDTGYHRGRLAEDVDISLRMRASTGGMLVYLPQMLVWTKVHPYRLSNQFVIERSSWIGYSRHAVGQSDLHQTTPERTLLVSIARLLITGDIFRGVRTLRDITRRLHLVVLSMVSIALGYLIGPLAT